MKRIYFVIPLFLCLITGCDSSIGPSSTLDEYFPLRVGNKWYYNSNYKDTNSINIIWEVGSLIEINGHQYYEIRQENFNNQNVYSDTSYYRLSGDTLFYYHNNLQEQILADFSLHLGDTTYWQNDLRVTEKTNRSIKFETPFSADYGYSITFKRGIGITSIIQNGFIFNQLTLIKSELN